VKARLLLVEDSESQGSQLAAALDRLGYEVSWVRSGTEALRRARSEPPDLIILDIMLQDVDGFSVCRWLRTDDTTRFLPIIMLTARDHLNDRVQGLKAGANDYLPKPFQTEELEARIYAALRVRTRHTELQQRNVQLESMLREVEQLAITDALTGVFNRRRFSDVLAREFALSKRYHRSLCCVLLDLDHFKLVNDQYGHDTGDQLLKQLAQELVDTVREVDLVARYGGEEFALLLPHTAKHNGGLAAQRMAEAIRELNFAVPGGSLQVTASFGVACAKDIASGEALDLVRAADAALYRAKELGRNRIEFYEPTEDFLSESE